MLNCTSPRFTCTKVQALFRQSAASVAPFRRLCSNSLMESSTKRSLGPDKAALLRQIPSVDELLHQPRLAKLAARIPRELLVEVAREVLAGVRDEDRKSTRLNSSHVRISYAVF